MVGFDDFSFGANGLLFSGKKTLLLVSGKTNHPKLGGKELVFHIHPGWLLCQVWKNSSLGKDITFTISGGMSLHRNVANISCEDRISEAILPLSYVELPGSRLHGVLLRIAGTRSYLLLRIKKNPVQVPRNKKTDVFQRKSRKNSTFPLSKHPWKVKKKKQPMFHP